MNDSNNSYGLVNDVYIINSEAFSIHRLGIFIYFGLYQFYESNLINLIKIDVFKKF